MKNIARILLSCLFLLTGARLLPAQTPPAAVPAVSELDPAPANLALKKSLDLRHADLQKRFDDWTKAATKFNNDFGGRKYKEKSKEAKDALKESVQHTSASSANSLRHELAEIIEILKC